MRGKCISPHASGTDGFQTTKQMSNAYTSYVYSIFLIALNPSTAFIAALGSAKQAILPVYGTKNQCAVGGCRT